MFIDKVVLNKSYNYLYFKCKNLLFVTGILKEITKVSLPLQIYYVELLTLVMQ